MSAVLDSTCTPKLAAANLTAGFRAVFSALLRAVRDCTIDLSAGMTQYAMNADMIASVSVTTLT